MAAMPGLFNAMEEKMKIDTRVTRFFIPLAVTLIRGGSALFICLTVLFIGQTYGVDVGAGSLFMVGLESYLLKGLQLRMKSILYVSESKIKNNYAIMYKCIESKRAL